MQDGKSNWTIHFLMSILFGLILGSYAYTFTVANRVDDKLDTKLSKIEDALARHMNGGK